MQLLNENDQDSEEEVQTLNEKFGLQMTMEQSEGDEFDEVQ